MAELLGSLVALLVVGGIWLLTWAQREVAVLESGLENAKLALLQGQNREDDLKEEYEERAQRASARYYAGTVKYEEVVSASNARWIEAARQNANLAEQLATIRLKYPEAYSESEEHIEDVSPSIPYSVELADWLAGFESSQARTIATEQVEGYRERGYEDEAIIELLEEEWRV